MQTQGQNRQPGIRTFRLAMVGSVLASLVGISLPGLAAASNSAGTLDPSFGDLGVATVNFGPADATTRGSLVILPDSEIAVADGVTVNSGGVTVNSGLPYASGDIDVSLLLNNGTVDTSFGTARTSSIAVSQASEVVANNILVEPNGDLVVCGTANLGLRDNLGNAVALARFTASGGTSGVTVTTTTPPSGQEPVDRCSGLGIQPNGDIVVLDSYSGEGSSRILRYLPGGQLDTSFGTNGVLTVPTTSDGLGVFYGMAVQPDGKILLAGNSGYLLRLNDDGTIDPTFGTSGDGMVQVNLPAPIYEPNFRPVDVEPDGSILVAGLVPFALEHYGEVLVHLSALGQLDSTFGAAGEVVVDPGPGNEEFPAGIVTDGAGNIYLSSGDQVYVSNIPASGYDQTIYSYSPEGQPNADFGSAGLISPAAGGIAWATDPAGNVLVVAPQGPEPYDLVVERYLGFAPQAALPEVSNTALLPVMMVPVLTIYLLVTRRRKTLLRSGSRG